MQLQHFNYLNELKYSKYRLFVLFIITFFSIVFWKQASDSLTNKIFYASLILILLSIISLIHYAFIVRYPKMLVVFRRLTLLFLDLATLTFVIALFQYYGLFLFPLYIIINMQTGLYFGIQYFYISILATSCTWIALLLYSNYWSTHSDIVAVFAITTFLMPLLYLNYIIKAYEEKHALSQELSIVTEDATYDSLTGLYNRKTYTEELKKAFKEKKFFAILFIDLNKFKPINDSYGHHIGDEILKEVARRLSLQMDENDFLARLGGDEFVIISRRKKVFLPKFVQKIEDNVIGYHKVEEIRIRIELSIGISMYPDDATSSLLLGKYADVAMYSAKKDTNRYHVFYEDIAEKKPESNFL